MLLLNNFLIIIVMLKHESAGKDAISNFSNWYKASKKPFIISNAGIGDIIISARIANYLGTGVFHNADIDYREKFGRSFCNLIKVPYFAANNKNKEIYDFIKSSSKFVYRMQVFVPQYLTKLGKNVDATMTEIFNQNHGFQPSPSKNKKIVLICPCASNVDPTKKRYMTKEQLKRIIELANPEKHKILLVGIEKDIAKMGMYPKCDWINTDIIKKHEGIILPSSIEKFVNTVGESSYAITTDTFLTHLTSIFNVPTTVIYKYNQKNEPMISPDPNDRFFLNPSWYKHFNRATYEELYSNLEKGLF